MLQFDPFVDGTPDGGSVVPAAWLNSVQGELKALLERQGVNLLEDGDLPSQHQQIATLLETAWVRIGDVATVPANVNGSVLIDTTALLDGNWAFYQVQSGSWVQLPQPELAVPQDTDLLPEIIDPTTENVEFLFNDTVHGARGGGNLHAVATEFVAGFLSPAGHQTLTALASTRPRVYESAWVSVAANQHYSFQHSLGMVPGVVSVWYQMADSSRSPVNLIYSPLTLHLCGCSIRNVTSNSLALTTGDRVWGGLTATGWQAFSSGNYKVVAIAHGNP